jgi:hypothetical protein
LVDSYRTFVPGFVPVTVNDFVRMLSGVNAGVVSRAPVPVTVKAAVRTSRDVKGAGTVSAPMPVTRNGVVRMVWGAKGPVAADLVGTVTGGDPRRTAIRMPELVETMGTP